MPETPIVLILGSAPSAPECAGWDWPGPVVAINSAWQVRPDWDYLVHPEDFPVERRPVEVAPGQRIVTAEEYVALQNRFGGFVYAGGTMAFTAAYWALAALRPRVMAFWACDMVYPATGPTHFYGTGAPDPLRDDISLRSLEAKSARLALMAAREGCACVNLSAGRSRLVLPRATRKGVARCRAMAFDTPQMRAAEAEEARLGYLVESGRYWQVEERFDPARIDALDALWLAAFAEAVGMEARA